MKVINKKGFTLIEIIAIMIIIGVICLITLPTVGVVVESSKKNTLKSSATNILKIVKQKCHEEKMDGNEITKNYTIEDRVVSSSLDVDNLPSSGTITVADSCKASVAVVEGNYCVILENDNTTVNTNILHCSGNYTEIQKTEESCFIFDEGTKTITGYDFDNESCPTEISIPDTISNIPVEYIGDFAFVNSEYDEIVYYASSATNEIFSDTIEGNILKYPAFSIYDIKLKNYKTAEYSKTCYLKNNTTSNQTMDYEIPNTDVSNYKNCVIEDTYIEDASDVGVITKVNLAPATNLKSIGKGAFMNNRITKLNIGDNTNLVSIDKNAFSNNLLSGVIDLSRLNLTSLGGFSYNNITQINIPNTVLSILNGAFMENQIGSLNFQNSVRKIGIHAFSGNKLTQLTFNNEINSIGVNAFRDNSETIDELVLPNSLTSISYGTFAGTKILSLIMGENIETVGHYAFSNSRIEVIEWNEALTTIKAQAFNYCYFRTFSLPPNITSINGGVFTYSFFNIDNEYVVIPDNITSIEYSGFYGMGGPNLIEVDTGKNVTRIGSSAFRKLWGPKLERAIVRNSVDMASNAFDEVSEAFELVRID